MKLKLALLILAGITSSVISNPIQGQDPAWPRFRGPNGSGIALEESRPPVEFGEEENLRWKVEFAEGTSSPVIWKDHIYLTCCVEEKGEMQLVCLNRHNGEHLWTRSYFPEKMQGSHPISSPAQSTPALDKDGIVVYDASYGMIFYDHNGTEKWRTPLNMVGHPWGHAVSPVIMDDKVIINQDFGDDDTRSLVALDKSTGEIAWKTLTQKTSFCRDAMFFGYSVPVRYRDQVILHRIGGVASYYLENGSTAWWMPAFTTGTSSPMVVDSTIFIALWNHFLSQADRGKYFSYDDFNRVIQDFDSDSDSFLSQDEFPDDFLLASRVDAGPARREDPGHTGHCRQYHLFPDQRISLCFRGPEFTVFDSPEEILRISLTNILHASGL